MTESAVAKTIVQLALDPETAEKLLKDGVVEIAQRRGDKKFKSFVKAAIVNNNTSKEAAKQLENALSGVGNIAKGARALSFVNVGLSAANLAVDTAGFIIIAHKLNELGSQIDGISQKMNDLAADVALIQAMNIEDIRKSCEEFKLQYNHFATKIKDNDPIERDEVEKYLIREKAFLSELIRLIYKDQAILDNLLSMIFLLLPAYTSMLSVFLKDYYYEKRSKPLNYDSFLEVFEELNSKELKNVIQDYYLLEGGLSYRDVLDVQKVMSSTLYGERLDIDDQLRLIENFSTDKAYLQFEKALEQAAREEIRKQAADIASKCGEYKEECYRVLASV